LKERRREKKIMANKTGSAMMAQLCSAALYKKRSSDPKSAATSINQEPDEGGLKH
jgi:hypothetical protein